MVIAFVCAVAALLIVSSIALVGLQRRIIYPLAYGSAAVEGPVPAGWIRRPMPAAGLDLHGYAAWRDAGAPTVIILHGNASTPSDMAAVSQPWVDAGWNVVVPEYPGYDGNSGGPSEAGMIASAAGGWRWASARGVGPARTVVVGNSIGSGPAIALAGSMGPAGLLVVSGVADMGRTVRARFPFVPSFAVFDGWRNADRLSRMRVRTSIWHGLSDPVVPHDQGVRLARAARVRLISVPGDHGVFWNPSMQEALVRRAAEMIGQEAAARNVRRVDDLEFSS